MTTQVFRNGKIYQQEYSCGHPLYSVKEVGTTDITGKMCIRDRNYYLDNKGTVMPPDAKCVAHIAVVTGIVEKSFAMRHLYKFGVFLQKNSFWNAQIEQIHVLPGKNIELVPLSLIHIS